jgi:hypothetical protein
MLNNALTYLKRYLEEKVKQPNEGISLAAINRDGLQPGNGDLLITLLRIEEERSVPSNEYYRPAQRDSAGNMLSLKRKNPPVLLNLYILVSAQSENYETALSQISHVLSAFREKNIFEKDEIARTLEQTITGIDSLTLELCSLTFEQHNSLWQTLGVKIMPAVLYKVKTVIVDDVSDRPEESVVLPYDKDTHEHGIILRIKNENEDKVIY